MSEPLALLMRRTLARVRGPPKGGGRKFGHCQRRGNATPRYQEVSAKLTWERTIAFSKKHLA